ncbi:MAG: tRNA (adenosine(37)-N6)-threonylcarbamoyltransferase complex dimerization subunit type 1 TsaB [Lachnospiraceae bacterium]|nr:tRNA (adenosine(37)-N6)-threonylcarbamoyltransferase complex dimerization subunit type 1 TsaB [Lachnospiraceae bacterium]
MKILALDTSGVVASAAIWEDDVIRTEYSMNDNKMHSQTILPMLKEALDLTDEDLSTVDAIATAGGPGSFTGLRIGAATVKGLAYALNKPILPVPTVDALAYRLWGTEKVVCPIMDARRDQTYTGLYEFKPQPPMETGENPGTEQELVMHVLTPQCAVPIEEIVEKINDLNRPVIFLGDGVPVFKERILKQAKVQVSFAPAHMNRQSAAATASLAAYRARVNMAAHGGVLTPEEGVVETAADHTPTYLRLSQAEREKQEKENAV